eukprot:XP_014773926.1 PREDICTED: kinesin-related protein 9-like [Octopus bimaculoides]
MELRGNIRVHCRLRPVFHTDVQGDPVTSVRTSPEQPEVALYFLDDENICVRSSKHNKVFEFERVYGPDDCQQNVFDQVQPMLTSLLDGYNVCIMAYGQTGSGKTHTMLGSHKNENYNLSHEAHPDEGVIPRAMRELFSLMSEKPTGTYQAEVSVVEIYNNDIRDLLSKDFKSKHDLVTCPDGSLSLPTVTFRQVASVKSVMSCVVHGLRTRRESATLVHEHSSRSHLVVTLLITTNDTTRAWHTDPATSDWSSSVISSNLPLSKEKGRTTPPNVSSPNPSVIKTKLQLVDLAGSECVAKNGVEGRYFLMQDKPVCDSRKCHENVNFTDTSNNYGDKTDNESKRTTGSMDSNKINHKDQRSITTEKNDTMEYTHSFDSRIDNTNVTTNSPNGNNVENTMITDIYTENSNSNNTEQRSLTENNNRMNNNKNNDNTTNNNANMAVLRFGCINVSGPGSSLKQGHSLNDFKWLNMDIIAISENMIPDTCTLAPIFDDFWIFASLGRPGMGWGGSIAQKRPRSRDTVGLPGPGSIIPYHLSEQKYCSLYHYCYDNYEDAIVNFDHTKLSKLPCERISDHAVC